MSRWIDFITAVSSQSFQLRYMHKRALRSEFPMKDNWCRMQSLPSSSPSSEMRHPASSPGGAGPLCASSKAIVRLDSDSDAGGDVDSDGVGRTRSRRLAGRATAAAGRHLQRLLR